VKALESNSIPRFNFRKANWDNFTSDLDTKITAIEADPKKYEDFRKLVWEVARKHIPRGCRKTYIPCLNDEGKQLYDMYITAYNSDPFSDETIQLGEELTMLLADERSERWKELITSIDMTHNSKKAWATIKRLDSEKYAQTRVAAVTPDQVANQLLQNGKPHNKEKGQQKKLKCQMEQAISDSCEQFEKFTPQELKKALTLMKTGKAPGLDGITTEMIQHFGPKTMSWVLNLFNNCADTCRIPNGWRKARGVVALLKPGKGKDPNAAKSYRPISLLCILYKLYERMIMDRMSPTVEEKLNPDQAGFRPGRSTCGQLLNLTQYIEDGKADHWDSLC